MTPAEAEARAAGIDAAVDILERHVAARAKVVRPRMRKLDAERYLKPLEQVLQALRKLAAETRKPNPFDGWTIQPWTDRGTLCVSKDGDADIVGRVYDTSWITWLPNEERHFAEGLETGTKGRRCVENALIKAGATIPWRKGKDR